MILHVFLIGQSPKAISFIAPKSVFVGQAIGSLISVSKGRHERLHQGEGRGFS